MTILTNHITNNKKKELHPPYKISQTLCYQENKVTCMTKLSVSNHIDSGKLLFFVHKPFLCLVVESPLLLNQSGGHILTYK